MRDLTIKIKTILTLFFVAGTLFLFSCDNHGKRNVNNKTKSQNLTIQQELLVGSWKDTSPSALHFTLFEDGTARSDNMKTLLYKNWKVNENQIIFTIESIGNGISTTDSVIYRIEELTNNELILRRGTYLTKYRKE